MIILDFGSGETCQNSENEVERMFDALEAVDTRRHKVIIKWQLFTEVPAGCEPLKKDIFAFAIYWAYLKHYWTTASVFDEESLKFLLGFHIPFIKIACRPDKYHLLDLIPPQIKVFVSVGPGFKKDTLQKIYKNVTFLHCIPEYPANKTVYETAFGRALSYSISDHTWDFELYHKYQPWFYECHFRLPDSTGLDSGPFARTPEQLKEIL